MTTAITLVASFVVSFTIVRIALIAMRLMGLAECGHLSMHLGALRHVFNHQ
ncbi:MAG: hypothetical protein VX090_14950 [Pseudomonadota bacterium]|nr:hypothetical protein [Pseudomonadota bacterium]